MFFLKLDAVRRGGIALDDNDLRRVARACLDFTAPWIVVEKSRPDSDWTRSDPCRLAIGDSLSADGRGTVYHTLPFEKKKRSEDMRFAWSAMASRRDACFCDVVDFWRWSLCLEDSIQWDSDDTKHVFDFVRWSKWWLRAVGDPSSPPGIDKAVQAMREAPETWWQYDRAFWIPTVKAYLIAERSPVLYGDKKKRVCYDLDSTVTGRAKCLVPNQSCFNPHTMSRTDRCLVRASRGTTFVSVDFSSAEVATLALESEDVGLSEFFVSESDLYAALAPKKWGERGRDAAKSCVLQFVYGAGEESIASTVDLSIADVKDLISRFARDFERATTWILEQEERGKKDQILVTRFGRAIWIGAEKDAARRAVNYVLQSVTSDWNTIAFVAIQSAMDLGVLGRAIVHIHDGYLLETASHRVEETLELVSSQLGDRFRQMLKPWGGDRLFCPYKTRVHGECWNDRP